MNTWKCSNCGYTFETPSPPPEKCPSCKTKCEFLDVTCYIPECEYKPGHKDDRL
jgi:rubredoxin